MKLNVMKRIIPVIIILAALSIIAFQRLDFCKNTVHFSREYESARFKLRWEVRSAGCSLEWRPAVVFMSAPIGSSDWQEIITGWTDEPHATPSDKSIKFLDASSGYVFYDEKFAVTTDSGQSWAVWDASQQKSYRDFKSIFIEDVTLGIDGRGQMRLRVADANQPLRKLDTSDYGKSWREE